MGSLLIRWDLVYKNTGQALNTGVSKPATTDDRGAYLVQDLQPGSYKVTVDSSGFASAVTNNVLIAQNTVRRLDIELKVAAAGEAVTVTAETQALQTGRADVNSQIATAETANLPMAAGRSFQGIFKTLPGFSYSSGGSTPYFVR